MHMSLSKFLQLRFNVFLYHKMGWGLAFLYIMILGRLYFFFNRSEKHKITRAVEAAFVGRKDGFKTKSITKNVFRGVLSHYYEKLFNAFSSAEELEDFLQIKMKSEGIAAIEEGLGIGKGVLLITGHFGGVELIPGYLAANNYPVTITVRFSSDFLRDISIKKAGIFSTKIIDADNTPNIMKDILYNLKENRIVVIQCDEITEWRPSRHNKVFFLGKQIGLDRTIDVLLKRGDASIVFGVMHRNDNQRYKFIVHSLKEMAKNLESSANMSIGAVVLKFLEHYIYKYPEEWYQWKCYPDIGVFPVAGAKDVIIKSPTLVRPAFSRIS